MTYVHVAPGAMSSNILVVKPLSPALPACHLMVISIRLSHHMKGIHSGM